MLLPFISASYTTKRIYWVLNPKGLKLSLFMNKQHFFSSATAISLFFYNPVPEFQRSKNKFELIKFMFSMKATKNDEIFTVNLTLTT